MSCGGTMMRTSFQPLAHLVDAAAERWLVVEHAAPAERLVVEAEITRSFDIGDRGELTFHGARYILSIRREGPASACTVGVHTIER